MKSEIAPLRERQARQVSGAVLEAVITLLENKSADDIAMAEVASAAGISLRTLYRYFPDRNSLLQAAGEHLYGSLQVPVTIAEPDDISRSFLEAARRLAARPRLTRALIHTDAGRHVRSAVRRQRVAAIQAALKPVIAGLDIGTSRRALAVITHLCSAASWVSVADESGLNDAEAQVAVGWAIDALIDTLRQMDRPPHSRSLHSRQTTASKHEERS
jgi:AcrR family transcriptional regulator